MDCRLLGQIWVDASTFRIRRIEGTPAKNPSIWIKNIHITMQFAELSGAWIGYNLQSEKQRTFGTGQSPAFFTYLTDLATVADAAMREV